MATGDPCACGFGMLGSCPRCNPWMQPQGPLMVSTEAVSHDEFLTQRIAILIEERDRAREECGHEKAMRKHANEEKDRWIRKWLDHEKVCSAVLNVSIYDDRFPRQGCPKTIEHDDHLWWDNGTALLCAGPGATDKTGREGDGH